MSTLETSPFRAGVRFATLTPKDPYTQVISASQRPVCSLTERSMQAPALYAYGRGTLGGSSSFIITFGVGMFAINASGRGARLRNFFWKS